jgi:rhodanese-related sulfurtransferase
MSAGNTISPAEFRVLMDRGGPLNLVDVRTPAEFARVHAAGARSLPLDQLEPAVVAAQRRNPSDSIYLICESGRRAANARERLEQAGVNQVYCVEGGMVAWEEMGLPVERGQSAVISIERQVRIGAGALVLIGTVLAWVVHPGFLVVPGVVGAGLVFAGITDYCGVAMVLCKMPWNR